MKTQKVISSTSEDSSYLGFLATLQLIGLGLNNSSIELHRQTLFDITEEKASSRTFTEEYRIVELGADYFDAEGHYGVSISDGERLGVRVECTFDVHIHCQSPDQSMVERFTKQDLRFMMLPYARTFISDMSGRMQIRPIILPMATAAGIARPQKRGRSVRASAKEA